MAWDRTKPAGSIAVRNSDDPIRANWAYIETTIGAEHNFLTDGSHTDITCTSIESSGKLEGTNVVFTPPIATPGSAADTGKLYGKDVNGKIELHWLDEDGNEVQVTFSGSAVFPSGTKLWFDQNTAPPGWTYDNTRTDRVLAVKGGANAYSVDGGSVAGTWTQPSHTLVTTEIPAHTHVIGNDTHNHSFGGSTPRYGSSGSDGSYGSILYGGSDTVAASVSINNDTHNHTCANAGSGGSHNHGTTWRPGAAVGIICAKD